MAIIDPEGLFSGDRLRRCSIPAQLHWPRLFLASNGFGRLEINYARIIGRAYPGFNPPPSETELISWIQEYASNHLLFLYEENGQLWGQWDTRERFLPDYKTSSDRRSPKPPEPAFSEWKIAYRTQPTAFAKCFENISEKFPYGVGIGVGVGKNTCASVDARVAVHCLNGIPSGQQMTVHAISVSASGPSGPSDAEQRDAAPLRAIKASLEMTAEQEGWFSQWWEIYWRKAAKKEAKAAFSKQVKSQERFDQVMAATQAQSPEMLAREPSKRPHGASWLRGERWQDEVQPVTQPVPQRTAPAASVGYREMEEWKKGINIDEQS